MPNQYLYQKMTAEEVVALMRQADLSVSDVVKLLGRDYLEVKKYMDPKYTDRKPTTAEALLLTFMAEYPEHVPTLIDMAEVRITGQRKPGGSNA